jgi:hypothetical protein
VHLILVALNRAEQPEKVIQRLREFGVPDPLVVRARSAAAALSTEVPIFAGLRSLSLGADEDRLLLLSFKPFESSDEAKRLIERLQLEMDADLPPSGKIYALDVIAAATQLPK